MNPAYAGKRWRTGALRRRAGLLVCAPVIGGKYGLRETEECTQKLKKLGDVCQLQCWHGRHSGKEHCGQVRGI
jgi:hypothetical protein